MSQLIYGLNAQHLTPALITRLNTFHIKGLRYILGIEHSYYSHVTNEEIIGKANLVLNKKDIETLTWNQFIVDSNVDPAKIKTTTLVGDLVLLRQQKLLGHILRRDSTDILREPTVDSDLNRPQQTYKRVGQPRDKWLEDNIERTFMRLFREDYNHDNLEHRHRLKQAAENRQF